MKTAALVLAQAGIAAMLVAAPAWAQEPMFPQQHPLYRGSVAPPGRSQLEELTSYPASMVTPPAERIDPNVVPAGWTAIQPIPRSTVVIAPQTVVLQNENGGLVSEHWDRFYGMASRGERVEIRGECFSACTLVVAAVKRENICIGRHAVLGFHLARYASGPDARKPNIAATYRMYYAYPADIRAWIDRRGGVERMPLGNLWALPAAELWGMGYRRCED